GGAVWGIGTEFGAFGGNAYEDLKNKDSSGMFVDALRSQEKTVKSVGDAKAAFEKAKADALAESNAIQSIVAGQSEQVNWLEFCKFLDEGMPRPEDVFTDGLVPKVGQYDYQARGREAYKNWDNWRRGKSKPKAIDEKAVKDPKAAAKDEEPD